jgi:hypothetical protein
LSVVKWKLVPDKVKNGYQLPKGEYNIVGEVSLTVKVTTLAMLSLAARLTARKVRVSKKKVVAWIDDSSYTKRSQDSYIE